MEESSKGPHAVANNGQMVQPHMEEKTVNTTACGTLVKAKTVFDEKVKTETESLGELLGSVTTHNCPGVRASARVIQKMKQDSIRSTTPPPNERDVKIKDEKNVQKAPSQSKPTTKATWTNLERNYFFDALNEFGKDFEAIGNFINSKLKRKSATDAAFKTKDQVRHHYYQTFHKICKYIKFSDDVKKPVQELYTLINYGEMRRKLQFVTDKHFMKLKHLVYNGHITVRCKGKNIRIKTPTCKALRRLNKLDDTLDDIRLPSKIEVIVSPANMESFGRVQAIAQNPRAKAALSLQKKLINLIKTFQYKWRNSDTKLAEEEQKMFPCQSPATDGEQALNIPQMCFRPKAGVHIHRPLLSITEYLSSLSLCLSAYEDRIGIKVRSETLYQDRVLSSKRLRCDSGSEKRSPENKKSKPYDHATEGENSNHGGELGDEVNEILSATEIKSDQILETTSDNELKISEIQQQDNTAEHENSNGNPGIDSKDNVTSAPSEIKTRTAKKRREPKKGDAFKPLISDDVIKKIRKGWTADNSDDITIGDLYVVFGQDSKLELEYFWTENSSEKKCVFTQKQNGMPYSVSDCDEPDLVESLEKSTLGNKLKHLLLIANLSERIRKKQCTCGHICDKTIKPRIDRGAVTKSFVSSKTFQVSGVDSVFRQPIVPFRRPPFSLDLMKQNMNTSRLKVSKQVLVQRALLPNQSGQRYDVVEVKDLQNKVINRHEASPMTPETFNSNTPNSPLPNRASNLELQHNMCEEPSSEIITTDEDDNNDVEHCEQDFETTDCGSLSNDITFSGSHAPDAIDFDESTTSSIFKSIPPMSPMQLLRDTSSNSRWLEDNLNDFSLNSLIGHLEEINSSEDIINQPSNMSIISESSVDYMSKFAEITASMQNEGKDL